MTDTKAIEEVVDIPMLKRMFEMYLAKYESACVFRDFSKALLHEGAANVLEHLLISAGESSFCNQKRSIVDDRRNAMMGVWRKKSG